MEPTKKRSLTAVRAEKTAHTGELKDFMEHLDKNVFAESGLQRRVIIRRTPRVGEEPLIRAPSRQKRLPGKHQQKQIFLPEHLIKILEEKCSGSIAAIVPLAVDAYLRELEERGEKVELENPEE